MKYAKTNKLYFHKRYCDDVGIITKVTGFDFDQGSGFAHLYLPNKHFWLGNKALAVIGCGYVILTDHDGKKLIDIPCNDPRVLYMYLWPFWKHHLGSKDENPPVPTMEEARAWMAKAGIPSEPDDERICSKSSARFFGFRL